MRTILIACVVLTSVSGCASLRDSRVNPKNWFSQTKSAKDDSLIPELSVIQKSRQKVYSGTPVFALTQAHLRHAIGGKILEIHGVMDKIGSYDIKIIQDPDTTDQTLRLVVKSVSPRGAPIGNQAAREFTAATFLTTQELAGWKTIQVQSQSNTIILRP